MRVDHLEQLAGSHPGLDRRRRVAARRGAVHGVVHGLHGRKHHLDVATGGAVIQCPPPSARAQSQLSLNDFTADGYSTLMPKECAIASTADVFAAERWSSPSSSWLTPCWLR